MTTETKTPAAPEEAKEALKDLPAVVEEAKLEVEKDIITEIPEEEAPTEKPSGIDLSSWTPKTSLGARVKAGEIKNLDDILDKGLRILEPQIVDALLSNPQVELLMIGQSKGKFGGGSRRLFKQTQKKTPEGNKPSFSSFAVIGDGDGHVGGGLGKSKDTLPAREKAVRAAKLNIFRIRRGCGSWECGCRTPHSIPFAVEGKCGSVRVRLMPAPKGKGLTIEKECQKVLKLAGLKDVWSKTFGQTRVKQNLVFALLQALHQLSEVKAKPGYTEQLGMVEGTSRKQQ
jgi:small subunit ribosomal protein S5